MHPILKLHIEKTTLCLQSHRCEKEKLFTQGFRTGQHQSEDRGQKEKSQGGHFEFFAGTSESKRK